MTPNESWKLAIGGLLAMAAALGIGRFAYTPILPPMIEALGWNKVDAGIVASANFLGYLVGALVAGRSVFSANPRRWLLIALFLSAATTAGTGVPSQTYVIGALRFIGGLASAFVIVCASALVLEQLSAAGRGHFAAIHFAGVGVGIVGSATVVAILCALGAEWRSLWGATGLIAFVAALFVAWLVPPGVTRGNLAPIAQDGAAGRGLAGMIVAYGLFGFGYVITATFLVTIVRGAAAIRPLEPWIWMLFGLAAVPSVPLWQRLGRRVGLMKAFSAACVIEAVGVAASVEWVTIPGVCVSALLLGGTVMGLTALGLMAGRALWGSQPQRAIGWMTASFGAGQMVGPTLAGILSESSGNLRSASLVAAAALMLAAALAAASSVQPARAASP